MRGDVHRVAWPRRARGHEQSGARSAVVVQPDDLPSRTWLVAPTYTSARPASSRPEVEVESRATRDLAEQTAAVACRRLGEVGGARALEEVQRVDAALHLVMEL
ncbi:type II toxin-antitoxin system PemK/MazF family toxin [uncultured Pseudokineococcus sp.]|uniref:type II toxin-antitoxin system PemK/MazF family toxin n=1 Tax=uncultured Pseudokineococcus sp. TaxID=1642928 RepID=UPI002633BDC4|nr:type II toxin-antitoxin system PemK/MazF family toxin [uncultured Pseudokineococcus sp.]